MIAIIRNFNNEELILDYVSQVENTLGLEIPHKVVGKDVEIYRGKDWTDADTKRVTDFFFESTIMTDTEDFEFDGVEII